MLPLRVKLLNVKRRGELPPGGQPCGQRYLLVGDLDAVEGGGQADALLGVGIHRLAGLLQERVGVQESDPLLQPCWVDQLGCKLASVHQVKEVAEDVWLYVGSFQAHTVTETDNT